jgi:hypothetical protein
MYNSFVFLLLITFLFPNVLKGDGKWKQVNALNLPNPTAIKKFHISRAAVGILFENHTLVIWNIKKNSIDPNPLLTNYVDDFTFSLHKDDIVNIKMLNKINFEKHPISSKIRQKSSEDPLIDCESELSLSSASLNSLNASIEVVSPSPETKNQKKGLFAVSEDKITAEQTDLCKIKIFNLDTFYQDPICIIIAESGVDSFKFLLDKKFFMVLQKNGTLNMYETDTWKSIFKQKNVSLYNISDDEQLLGILKKNEWHLKLFRHI